MDPAQLEFREGPYGKPELISNTSVESLKFNLSHSHEAALVALTVERQIGVDIEYVKPGFKWQEVAERFFAPGEITRLRALPADEQPRGFFTCWTRKEAYIKAKGGGLSIPLQDFEVSLSSGASASLISCTSDPKETTRWSLAKVDVGPEYEAAVAVHGHGWCLKHWRWDEHVSTGSGT
jgi:4'-phosphopantetheinyl transferase